MPAPATTATTPSATNPAACDTTATETTGNLRASSPPAKSAVPHVSEAPKASATAATTAARHGYEDGSPGEASAACEVHSREPQSQEPGRQPRRPERSGEPQTQL